MIYLSTFSKTLAPGFRVGWMVAPAPLIERFETAKQSVDLMTGSLDQRIVHEAVRRGALERLAPSLRALYRGKRDVMEQALRARARRPAAVAGAEGRLLPVGDAAARASTTRRCSRARSSSGWCSSIGSAFYVDGTGHDRIRLSFSAPTAERIQEGARRLAAA